MLWKKKKLNYEAPLPPLSKSFHELTKQEAQACFEWYLGAREERIAYLRKQSGIDLDYSPESLVPLWAWFLKNAEIEYTPKDQLAALREQLNAARSPLTEWAVKDHETQLSFQTELMVLDISMYWGELFVRKDPRLRWDYYTRPKNDAFVNQPCILGFPNEVDPRKPGVPLPPHHMVRVMALRLLRGTAGRRDLLDTYEIWVEKLKKGTPP